MDRITYYHILGVSSDAPDDEILAAFRRRVREWHPDVCPHPDAEERMREINEAAETLCDPERRRRYDLALARKGKAGKERSPQSRATGPAERPVTGLSKNGAQGSIPFQRWVRPETCRIAAVIGVFIILGILSVAYFGYPPETDPARSRQGDMKDIPVSPASPAISVDPGTEGLAGDALLEEGNYSGALAAYDAVIAENPGISGRDIWYNRGLALQALGLYSDAAVSFDRALQASPDDSSALAQKGAALLGLGQYNESLIYTDRALAINPEIGWIWSNRGIALENLGYTEEAGAAFEKAGMPAALPGNVLYRNVVVSPGVAIRW